MELCSPTSSSWRHHLVARCDGPCSPSLEVSTSVYIYICIHIIQHTIPYIYILHSVYAYICIYIYICDICFYMNLYVFIWLHVCICPGSSRNETANQKHPNKLHIQAVPSSPSVVAVHRPSSHCFLRISHAKLLYNDW